MFFNSTVLQNVKFLEILYFLNKIIKKGNEKIPLSTKEYNVLEYLVKNPNVSLSPEKIYTNVWKVKYGDLTAVAVYIQRLRKKIEDDQTNCKYIKTDFGKGYIFCNYSIKHNFDFINFFVS